MQLPVAEVSGCFCLFKVCFYRDWGPGLFLIDALFTIRFFDFFLGYESILPRIPCVFMTWRHRYVRLGFPTMQLAVHRPYFQFSSKHLMHCFCVGTSLEDWLKVQSSFTLWYLSRPGFPNGGLASGNCIDGRALRESYDTSATSVCRRRLCENGSGVKIVVRICGSPPN